MKKKIVKLGVVGLDRGLWMISEVIKQDDVQMTAICDRDPERLAIGKKHFEDRGVKDLQCYDNYDDFLKSDVEAIVIATPATDHVSFVIKALEAGKHVLSEIPTVHSLEEAKALRAAVKAHPHQKYMAGENCCYWAFIQMWKQMREEGKFGDVLYAEGEYIHSQDYRNIKAEDYPDEYWRTTYPAIRYLTHSLGPLLYIMDDYCVSVSCMTPDIQYTPYRPACKNGVALFKTAKGAVIRIFICHDAFVGYDHNYALIGTRGSIETDKVTVVSGAHSFARLSDIPGSIDEKVEIPVAARFPSEPKAGHDGADQKMMSDFIRCIVEDTEPTVDVDLGIRMSLPGIIAHESSLQGGALMEIPDITNW